MKKILIMIACIIFLQSCKEDKNNKGGVSQKPTELPNVKDTNTKEIPKNLPNQKNLDQYGLLTKHWRTSEVIGGNPTVNSEITLSERHLKRDSNRYGNTIVFKDNNTFRNSYSAPCGNDCFPVAQGEYFFSDRNHIYINISRFEQSGDCKNIENTYKSNFIKYTITKNKEKVQLRLSDQKYKNETYHFY